MNRLKQLIFYPWGVPSHTSITARAQGPATKRSPAVAEHFGLEDQDVGDVGGAGCAFNMAVMTFGNAFDQGQAQANTAVAFTGAWQPKKWLENALPLCLGHGGGGAFDGVDLGGGEAHGVVQ